jgi:rRNA maturation endonuclease Nob1
VLALACGALTLAALLYVFWFTPEPPRSPSSRERELEFLQERKEALYENLRDLHLEYRMGKLSEADYQQMKERYQVELAAWMAQAERVTESASPADLSAEVPQSRTKAEVRRTKQGRCTRCGRDNPIENRFCGACGGRLSQQESA